MSPNPKSTVGPPENPSTPDTPEWSYNELMRHIEPDLMTDFLPKHEEVFASETKEQTQARMKAYDEAFAVFDKAVLDCEDVFAKEVHELKTKAHEKAIKAEKKEQKKELKKIEDEIDSAGEMKSEK
ncbi:hypothetical protein EXS70_01020 [Candidatus Peribacteria bacterium]|nr:hypothetical protein [Candidatus Peribacteria bacterium]